MAEHYYSPAFLGYETSADRTPARCATPLLPAITVRRAAPPHASPPLLPSIETVATRGGKLAVPP
eukprot:5346115-Prymnesium_polylepis.1